MQSLVDRIEIHSTSLEDLLHQFSSKEITKVSLFCLQHTLIIMATCIYLSPKVALSNIFEYMSEEAADSLFVQLAASMVTGGRIAYWNLYISQQPSSESARQWLCLLQDLSSSLYKEDRGLWYSSFNVLQVK